MSALPAAAERSHRRGIILGLAAIAGFIGGGGGELGAASGSMLRLLAGLFVMVFFVTLGWSVLSDAIRKADTEVSETPEGTHEAVFGSP